jgi:hypothetical protein
MPSIDDIFETRYTQDSNDADVDERHDSELIPIKKEKKKSGDTDADVDMKDREAHEKETEKDKEDDEIEEEIEEGEQEDSDEDDKESNYERYAELRDDRDTRNDDDLGTSGIDNETVFVRLSGSDTNKQDKFRVVYSNLHKTPRLKLLDKENKMWISHFGQELYRNRIKSKPNYVGTDNTNSSKKTSNNDTSERDYIVDTLIDSEIAYAIFTTSDKEVDDFLVIDPIFVIKRFPTACWGIDFPTLFRFIKTSTPFTKYAGNFKNDKFISDVGKAFPKFITSEEKYLRIISFDKWRKRVNNNKTSNIKQKIEKKKKPSTIDQSEASTDAMNDEDVENEATTDKQQQVENNEEMMNINEDNTTPESRITLSDIDDCISKFSRTELKEFEAFIRKESNAFWLDVLLPRTTSIKSSDKKKKNSAKTNRVLPIVLLPFFLRTLHYSVRANNCVSIICDSLSKDLMEYRNELVTKNLSTKSDLVASLDLTIKQLNVNATKYGFIYHIISHKTEMIATTAYENVVEKLKCQDKMIKKQKDNIKTLKKSLNKLTEQVAELKKSRKPRKSKSIQRKVKKQEGDDEDDNMEDIKAEEQKLQKKPRDRVAQVIVPKEPVDSDDKQINDDDENN